MAPRRASSNPVPLLALASADSEPDRPEDQPEWVEAVRAALIAWYERGHRMLPWRADRDPYRILVSEMMLVQTTVAAVIPYFERFLKQFPTLGDLAAADESAVLKAWEGLGYYRRARQLHAAAKSLVHEHAGQFPRTAGELEQLPGIGRYIAGAIASFAFDTAAPIVEANTQRVLARLVAEERDLGRAASRARLWEVAERLVPATNAGTFNQALMELGATCCVPRMPQCLICPVAACCRARAIGLQDRLPVKPVRPAFLTSRELGFVAVRKSRVLMARRSRGGLWEEFWEFPTAHLEGADPAGRVRLDAASGSLAQAFRTATGLSANIGTRLAEFRYTVTQYRVTLEVAAANEVTGRPRPGPGYAELAWLEPGAVDQLARSSVTRRLLARLRASGEIE